MPARRHIRHTEPPGAAESHSGLAWLHDRAHARKAHLLSVVKLDQASGMATTAESAGAGFVTAGLRGAAPARQGPGQDGTRHAHQAWRDSQRHREQQLGCRRDLVARVEEVRTLIARLDKPDVMVVRELPLRHLSAQQAVAAITRVVAKQKSVRATLRRNVRRMLAKYGYPPDLSEDATRFVLRQADLSAENQLQ